MATLLGCHSQCDKAAVLWATAKGTLFITIMKGGGNKICLHCKAAKMILLTVALLVAVLAQSAHHIH
jgi:hypothetical protein